MGCHQSLLLVVCVLLLACQRVRCSSAPRRLLEEQQAPSPADVLAVVFLVTDLGRAGKDRIGLMKTALKLMSANIMPTTPCTVYIFTLEKHYDSVVSKLGTASSLGLRSDQLNVHSIKSHHWHTKIVGGSSHLWMSPRWPAPYRLMGEWRLQHMPQLVRAMGHQYLLQMDDDSYVKEKLDFNIVEMFRQQQYYMGARLSHYDITEVNWGLAEMAAYFLVAERMLPVGDLFEHCDPPNVRGLYTRRDLRPEYIRNHSTTVQLLKDIGMALEGGWDGFGLVGNFAVFDLEFWFKHEVQRFVQLCRSSGGHFRFRWNEQGVQSMVVQIFVPKQNFHWFNFSYQHKGSAGAALKEGLAAAGIDAT